jgi:hypothetical protein
MNVSMTEVATMMRTRFVGGGVPCGESAILGVEQQPLWPLDAMRHTSCGVYAVKNEGVNVGSVNPSVVNPSIHVRGGDAEHHPNVVDDGEQDDEGGARHADQEHAFEDFREPMHDVTHRRVNRQNILAS